MAATPGFAVLGVRGRRIRQHVGLTNVTLSLLCVRTVHFFAWRVRFAVGTGTRHSGCLYAHTRRDAYAPKLPQRRRFYCCNTASSPAAPAPLPHTGFFLRGTNLDRRFPGSFHATHCVNARCTRRHHAFFAATHCALRARLTRTPTPCPKHHHAPAPRWFCCRLAHLFSATLLSFARRLAAASICYLSAATHCRLFTSLYRTHLHTLLLAAGQTCGAAAAAHLAAAAAHWRSSQLQLWDRQDDRRGMARVRALLLYLHMYHPLPSPALPGYSHTTHPTTSLSLSTNYTVSSPTLQT